MQTFRVGDEVEWTSNYTTKRGRIVALVPEGQPPTPRPTEWGGGTSRTGESYIVEIRGPRGGVRTYWPRASLLKVVAQESSGEAAAG